MFFLVIDAILASDNPLCFRKNFVERIEKLIMTVEKIRDEKLHNSINGESTKIALLYGKIDKYE